MFQLIGYSKKAKLFFVFLMSLIIILSNTININHTNYAANENMTVKTALPTEKITLNEDISKLSDAPLYISGAKGETDAGQVIVSPNKDVKNFDAAISVFKSGQNTIDKANVNIYAEVYTLCEDKRYGGILPAGWYPDALIPINYLEAKGENKIKAGENQGFWIDVKIPKTAAAGVYQATLTLTFDGDNVNVPVSLTVFDFMMPSAPPFRTAYLIWQDWLIDGELDNTMDKVRDYYELLLDYNISGYVKDYKYSDEEFVSWIRQYYDRLGSFIVPYKTTVDRFTLDTAYVKSQLKALAKAALEDGVNYFEKANYYFDLIYDEPASSEQKMAALRTTVLLTDSIEQSVIDELVSEGKITSGSPIAAALKNIHHLIPAAGRSFADIAVDPCPAYIELKTTEALEFFSELAASGMPLSTYGCINNDRWPSAAHQIDDYLITARDLFWLNYQYGFNGDLLWNVNNYVNTESTAGLRYGKLNDFYRVASHDTISNGDGYMLYPGLLYGSEKPFPSIRLAQKRDGIDDYTYMSILNDLYQSKSGVYGQTGFTSKKVVTFINQSLLGRGVSKLNFSGLSLARENLAKLITLANDDFIISNLETAGNKINYTVYRKNESVLKINGTTVTSSAAGTGAVSTGSIDMPQSKQLTISYSRDGVSEDISFELTSPYSMTYGYENQQEIGGINVYTEYNSSVTLNTSQQFSLSGNSARIVLKGYVFPQNQNTLMFKPQFYFNIDFSVKGAVKFCVYNSGETRNFDVILSGNSVSTAVYDTVRLKGGQWTEIVVDNLKIISLDPSAYTKYTRVGLRTTENLLKNGVPQQVVLYLDNVYTADKQEGL